MALENSKLDSYKTNVKAASTANVNLNISMLNGTWVYPIIDGYQTKKGDRVLLKDQTDAKTNGIYTVQPGKLHLATDNNNNTSLVNGANVKVLSGTVNGLTEWEIGAIEPLAYSTTNKVWTLVASGGLPELVFAADLAAIQLLTGDMTKQYIAEDTGNIYRFNGVAYVEMSQAAAQTLAQTLGQGRDVDVTGIINSNDGQASIDFNVRELKNFGGQPTLNYNSRRMFALDGSTTVLNWSNNQLFDSNAGFLSVNWESRFLKNSSPSNTKVLDWESNQLFTVSNVKTLDWQLQRAFDSGFFNNVSIDWNNRTLNTDLSNGVLNWATQDLKRASGGAISLSWNSSELKDTSALPSIKWDERKLLNTDGITVALAWGVVSNSDGSLGIYTDALIDGDPNANNGVTKLTGRKLIDSSGTDWTIDWENKQLSDGVTTTLNWSTGQLTNTAGNLTLDWDNNLLVHSGGQTVINWENQQALDNSGVISIDWSNNPGGRRMIDTNSFDSVKWEERTLIDGSGAVTSINWHQKFMNDSSGDLSVSWQQRQLSDGTQISLDWNQRYLQGPQANGGLNWFDVATTGRTFIKQSVPSEAITANGNALAPNELTIHLDEIVPGTSGFLTFSFKDSTGAPFSLQIAYP